MISRRSQILVTLSCLLAVAACNEEPGFPGDVNEAGPPTAPPPALPPAQGTYVQLSSDFGDFIGAGEDYLYSLADSLITVAVEGAHLSIDIEGDERWTGEFQLPDSYTALESGTYPNLTRYPFHDPVVGGMSWSGEGRGCNTLDGSLTIDSVTYSGDELTDIDLTFIQYCDGNSLALQGQIHWESDDTTTPSGPVDPAPAGLWEPAPGSTPDTGNYIYLVSEQGDYIGGGADYLYTDATATLTFNTAEARVSVSVAGAENWNGEFQAMNTITNLEVGYYGDLQRYPFHNPTKGGLSWSGEGRGCNKLIGWFVVDGITYTGDAITALDLRFAQHCEGGTAALLGEIHWVE